MTEFRFERTKEAVADYIKIAMFGKSFAHKFLIAALITCLAAVGISGIVMFIVMDRPETLIITAAAAVLAAAYPLFLHFFMKSLVKKMTKENPEEKGVTVAVSEREILLIRDNRPCGKLEWADITDITEGKEGFFLTEKQGSLLILGKSSVHSGSYEEAVQILNMKKAALK